MTLTCAKLVFPDRHQMVLTHGTASAVWSVSVWVGVMSVLCNGYAS